jgi:hypothetical protein
MPSYIFITDHPFLRYFKFITAAVSVTTTIDIPARESQRWQTKFVTK